MLWRVGFLPCVEMQCIGCLIPTSVCVCVCEEDSPSCSVSAGLLSFPLAGDYAAHISPSALGWPFGSQGPLNFRARKGFKDDVSPQVGAQIEWMLVLMRFERQKQDYSDLLLPQVLILFLFLLYLQYKLWVRISVFVSSSDYLFINLDCILMKDPLQESLSRAAPGFLIRRNCEAVNVGCLKPLRWEMFCYAAEVANTAGSAHVPVPFGGFVLLPCRCVSFLSLFCSFVL